MAARRDRDGPTWAAAATGTGSPSPILRRSWASFPPPPRPETEPAFPPEALEPSPGKKQGGGGDQAAAAPAGDLPPRHRPWYVGVGGIRGEGIFVGERRCGGG
jgi:hypothetical protein